VSGASRGDEFRGERIRSRKGGFAWRIAYFKTVKPFFFFLSASEVRNTREFKTNTANILDLTLTPPLLRREPVLQTSSILVVQ